MITLLVLLRLITLLVLQHLNCFNLNSDNQVLEAFSEVGPQVEEREAVVAEETLQTHTHIINTVNKSW